MNSVIPKKIEISVELKDSCNDCRCCFGNRFFRKKTQKSLRTQEVAEIDIDSKVQKTYANIMSKSGNSFDDNE